MALAGLHVVCSHVANKNISEHNQAPIGDIEWAENLTAPATSTLKAGSVQVSPSAGRRIFRFYAVADSFVVVGAAPVIGGNKIFLKAATYYDVYVKAGDTYVWALA